MTRIALKMQTDPQDGSCRLMNPSKDYFLKLSSYAVRIASKRSDKDGVLRVRRAMNSYGMDMNLNGSLG